MKFKNGTNDEAFKPLKMFGHDNLTLPAMIKALDVSSNSLRPTVSYVVTLFCLVDYHQLHHQLVFLLQPDRPPRMFRFQL